MSKSAPLKNDISIDIGLSEINDKRRGACAIDTAEDAVSLTEVLSESRRLRRMEENLHLDAGVTPKKKNDTAKYHEEPTVSFTSGEQADTEPSVSIKDPSVKPKGKNPFERDD